MKNFLSISLFIFMFPFFMNGQSPGAEFTPTSIQDYAPSVAQGWPIPSATNCNTIRITPDGPIGNISENKMYTAFNDSGDTNTPFYGPAFCNPGSLPTLTTSLPSLPQISLFWYTSVRL
jgi:hypothetical protein